jgi:acetyl-CoA acyltransferase
VTESDGVGVTFKLFQNVKGGKVLMIDFANAPVIVAYGRSPVTKAFKGALSAVNPIEIAGQTLMGVLDRAEEFNRALVEDVIVGCAFPANLQNFNIAKQIAFRAGLPDETTALTVSRICSSGLQSVSVAANSIKAGEADILIAGGVESMSNTIMFPRPEEQYGWFSERRPSVYDHPAVTAEKVAKLCGVSRRAQDAFSVESHRKAAVAQDNGWFDDQIIPIKVRTEDGGAVKVGVDEGVRRDTNIEKLSNLKPSFWDDGTVTAGNASQMSDGAAFILLTSPEKAKELGQKPIARFLGFATAGLAPEYMGLGPTKAVPKLLEKLNIGIDQLDTIELNEAFAAQAIPCIEQLGFPPDKTNPEGGAIGLGHPLGGTGSIMICKAISHMKRTGGQYGLITMCVGGGIGAAGMIEMIR